MEELQLQGTRGAKKRWFRIIIVAVMVILLGAMIFTYFRIITEARLALKEAKNVKLTLDMLDIEYYRDKKSVYNANRPDGLEQGVDNQVSEIAGQKGRFEILDYDKNERIIRYMIYETADYRVIYRYDKTDGEQWRVDYLVNIFDYSH